jgi:hypothetical protein
MLIPAYSCLQFISIKKADPVLGYDLVEPFLQRLYLFLNGLVCDVMTLLFYEFKLIVISHADEGAPRHKLDGL